MKNLKKKDDFILVVNCDFNEISELPDELSVWTKMRGINASHNKVSLQKFTSIISFKNFKKSQIILRAKIPVFI